MSLIILNEIPLTITRPAADGYYKDGEYVEGTSTNINILCSIQPFRKGDSQMTLPEGLRAEDALIVYTKTEVKTINQFDFTKADRAIIDSQEYVVLNSENWSRHSVSLAHYKCLFVRSDKAKAGGL